MIEGVLLDFYGTVVHEDDEVIAQICAEIVAASTFSVEVQDVSRFWWAAFSQGCQESHRNTFRLQRTIERMSIESTLNEFRVPLDPDAISQRLFEHWRRPAIFEDAVDFLSGLDLPVCIISNIDRSDLEAALAHQSLEFQHVVTSEDVRSYKPRAEPFRRGLEQLGLRERNVLHIGDSASSDVAGANAANIPVAWVNRRRRSLPHELSADYVAASLADLKSVLTRDDCREMPTQ